MSHRNVLKRIIGFGKREYKEKKPLGLKILRVKSKSILTRGLLPSLNVKTMGLIRFLVVLDYNDYIRLYSFSREGDLLGGQNLEKEEKTLQKVDHATKLEYHLPKEKPKLTLEDITAHYQEEFEKHLQHFNQSYGLHLEYPKIIKAEKDIPVQARRNFGVRKTEKFLLISLKVYKKSLFEVICVREILHTYLKEVLVLNQDIKDFEVFWYDLSLLLTNFYLQNKKQSFFSKLMQKGTISFLHFNGYKYYISDKVLEVLKTSESVIREEEKETLFKNITGILNILSYYEIRVNLIEFANILSQLCNYLIKEIKDNLFKIHPPERSFAFYYEVFKKSAEVTRALINAKEEKEEKTILIKSLSKEEFLSLAFAILGKVATKETFPIVESKDIYALGKSLKNYQTMPIISQEISHLNILIKDIMDGYLFDQIIKIDAVLNRGEENQLLKLEFKLINQGSTPLRNLIYAIDWNPRSRLKSPEIKENIPHLSESYTQTYKFQILAEGTVTFNCHLSITDPLDPHHTLKKRIKIQKFTLPL